MRSTRQLGGWFALAAALASLPACRSKAFADEPEACPGVGPECYTPTADGCCAAEAQPSLCGPKDAPLGTHLKWMCPDKTSTRTKCRGIGPSCVPRPVLQHNDSSGAPHAAVTLEVFNPDAGPRIMDAGGDAASDRKKTKKPSSPARH